MKAWKCLLIGLLALTNGCGRSGPETSAASDDRPLDSGGSTQGPVQPLPRQVNLDPGKVELGHRLFLDKRLSHDNSIACASCHALERYGMDGRTVSTGIGDHQGFINAPTVYNAGFNFRQFWDGRAATLEEQAGSPITNALEMGSTWPEVLSKLAQDKDIQTLSQKAYGRPLDEQVVRDAIATFERSLITPDSPFDRYLRGEQTALTPQQKDGWKLFRGLGCVSCHQGINLGGNMYSDLGVMNNYFAGRKPSEADWGLYNQTGREEDKFKFKVPGLRNVEMTGPYYHDGNVKTLEAAVSLMAHTQLGVALPQKERDDVVAFLKSLTGKLPTTER